MFAIWISIRNFGRLSQFLLPKNKMLITHACAYMYRYTRFLCHVACLLACRVCLDKTQIQPKTKLGMIQCECCVSVFVEARCRRWLSCAICTILCPLENKRTTHTHNHHIKVRISHICLHFHTTCLHLTIKMYHIYVRCYIISIQASHPPTIGLTPGCFTNTVDKEWLRLKTREEKTRRKYLPLAPASKLSPKYTSHTYMHVYVAPRLYRTFSRKSNKSIYVCVYVYVYVYVFVPYKDRTML